MFDLLIKNGDIVDGTGAKRQRADVGIKDGRIAQILPTSNSNSNGTNGASNGIADQTIDATGHIVSPGFIDVHTHYDAQAFWDTTLSPSPLHGVTTVISGNCGFTIAPLSDNPEDGEYLKRMLSRVEGMPLESLNIGVPWNWKSYGEYLDIIDNTLSINTGFMVGHSAIRRVVMGADATKRESTEEELAEMIALLREGIEAGGLGFSSTWSRTHNDAEGNMVPSRFANEQELIELCGVCGDYEGTSIEFLPNVGPFEDWTIELMSAMSAKAKRQLNWNIMFANAKNIDACYTKLEAGTHAAERGGKVVALTIPMNLGVRLCFANGFGLDALPGWEKYMFMPFDEKIQALKDPETRKILNDLAQSDDMKGNPLKAFAEWGTKIIYNTISPENEKYKGRIIQEIADEEGKSTWDTLCDIVVEDKLQTSFGTPNAKESNADWKARVELWRDGRAVIGASDAGAHLDFLASFNYTTYVLGNAVREAKALSVEEAIHLMTSVQANLYGIKERGELKEGYHADIVIFDENTVATEEVEMQYDLPSSDESNKSGRLFANAKGIKNVICNGAVITQDGEFSGAKKSAKKPGKVLRSGADTYTPNL